MAEVNGMAEIFVIRRVQASSRDSVTRCVGRIAFLAALTATMAGCAGSSESGSAASVTGNQQGGKVPYAEGKMQAAMDAAQAHCGQFGKKAQITQMSPVAEGGGVVGFQCR